MFFLKQALISSLNSYFPVKKHQIELENTWRFTPTAIIYIGQHFVRQCPPPDYGPFKKNNTDYNFWSRDHKCGLILCLMAFWVQGSKSQYLEAFVCIFKPYFILIFKKCLIRGGGTPRLIKFLPCAENFCLSLTDDIFVICNQKIIKNNRNTYDNVHFEEKIAKKKWPVHISGYIPK